MKILKITFFTILSAFFINSHLFGSENDSIKIAKIDYEYGWDKAICNLKIIVQCSIDCKLGTKPTNNKSQNTGHMYYEKLKEVFYDSITTKAKIFVPIPEYIADIIDMFPTDSLKIVAKKIYERESNHIQIFNGKCITNFKIEFNYPLLINKKTKLAISLPRIKFRFHGQMIETEPALIEIN